MGETRDPALGGWTVFEGTKKKVFSHATANLDFFSHDIVCGDIKDPLAWPLTFRVHRIRNGIAEGIDVTVNEDLTYKVTAERISMRTGRAVK